MLETRTWQPIVYRGYPCEHTSYASTVGGYVLDCDEPATFIRATEYGHQRSCNKHLDDWDDDDE